jgi:hypothetical protein
LENSKTIIENSLSHLISKNNNNGETVVKNFLNIDDITSKSLNKPCTFIKLTSIESKQRVVLFNSQLQKRVEIVSFEVNTPHVHVVDDSTGSVLENVQISHVWLNAENNITYAMNEKSSSSLLIDDKNFELLFEVSIDPMSTKSFTIQQNTKSRVKQIPKVSFYYRNSFAKRANQFISDFISK